MARKRRKRSDPHVRLYGWMMKTLAWQSLSVGPRSLLVELYSLWDGTNNGKLYLSIRQAASRLHVSPNTVATWFDVLIERGFIKVAQIGSFRLKIKHATTWSLTEHPIGDALPTKDFARWRPADDGVIRRRSRRGGFRWNKATRKQNAASNFDTVGIKECVKDSNLSPRKTASRYRTLTPSQPKSAAVGVNDRHTDTVTMGIAINKTTVSQPEAPFENRISKKGSAR